MKRTEALKYAQNIRARFPEIQLSKLYAVPATPKWDRWDWGLLLYDWTDHTIMDVSNKIDGDQLIRDLGAKDGR